MFDGIKSTDKNIILKNYNRIFLPANSRNFIRIPGKDGSLPRGNKSKEDITINLEVAISGTDEEEINTNIENANTWLSKRGQLSFWDSLDRYYMGEVVGEVSVENRTKWGDFTLQFRCHPIKYGETKTVDIAGNLFNEGTYESEGTIKVTIASNIDYLRVELNNTNESIQIGNDFVEGDVVTIDLEEEKVYKNGYLIMKYVYLESEFFKIPAGEFSIDISNGNATLEFTERWL